MNHGLSFNLIPFQGIQINRLLSRQLRVNLLQLISLMASLTPSASSQHPEINMYVG